MSDSDPCAADSFVQSTASIAHHEPVSSRYYLLRLRCPEIAARARPGQFVMLACAPDSAGSGDPLLPRPLAILDARNGSIELLYFVAGRGTEILRTTAENAMACATQNRSSPVLRIIGPLGKGFEPIPNVDVHIGVGGGSGVAPLVFFFRRFAAADSAAGKNSWRLILAARGAAHLARSDVVQVPGQLTTATDDGSAGFHGNGVQALESLLNGEFKGRSAGVYAAGPEPMMEAAARLGQRLGLPVRVSLEGRMACGVGVCRACVVDGVTPHYKTGLLRRTACQDGPVFDTKELAGWASLPL